NRVWQLSQLMIIERWREYSPSHRAGEGAPGLPAHMSSGISFSAQCVMCAAGGDVATPMEELEEAERSSAARDVKGIKRYTNRKLYDTVESRYVTLDEIAEMVKLGAEVKIIDNRSKEDLTSVTLAQIIFEEEKKKSRMPLAMLREIIRHPGESISGFIQKEL